MSTPYLGQLLLVGFNFAPSGWAFCNGQLLSINQNLALFALLGTTYGGNGTTNFALPNLQGRVAVSTGSNYILGQSAGNDSVTLLTTQMPTHTHTLAVSAVAGGALTTPQGNTVGTTSLPAYAPSAGSVMDTGAVNSYGSSQPHENRTPFTTLNWIIALSGIFPSRN